MTHRMVARGLDDTSHVSMYLTSMSTKSSVIPLMVIDEAGSALKNDVKGSWGKGTYIHIHIQWIITLPSVYWNTYLKNLTSPGKTLQVSCKYAGGLNQSHTFFGSTMYSSLLCGLGQDGVRSLLDSSTQYNHHSQQWEPQTPGSSKMNLKYILKNGRVVNDELYTHRIQKLFCFAFIYRVDIFPSVIRICYFVYKTTSILLFYICNIWGYRKYQNIILSKQRWGWTWPQPVLIHKGSILNYMNSNISCIQVV